MEQITPLVDVAMLEAALAESQQRPVVLFKHSRTCGVSYGALDELQTHIERDGMDAAYKMIVVQSHRGISDTVSTRFGIRHETPQAIVIRDGAVVWKASHFRITADEIAKVLATP